MKILRVITIVIADRAGDEMTRVLNLINFSSSSFEVLGMKTDSDQYVQQSEDILDPMLLRVPCEQLCGRTCWSV